MNRPVKVHRIHPFPPFSFSVADRLERIVGHAFFRTVLVAGVTHRHELAPSPGRRGVKPDAKTHSMLARGFFPGADNVHLGTDIHRIPRLISRIPVVEIVVMIAHRHEVARAHFDVQIHQLIWLPPVNPPIVSDVLVTVFRWVAEVFDVEIILWMALLIHAARIPVAILRLAVALIGHGLRIPMRPCAELRIPPPLRRLVMLADLLPVGRIRTGGHRQRRQVPNVRRQSQVAVADNDPVNVHRDIVGGHADGQRGLRGNHQLDDRIEKRIGERPR